MAQLPRLVQALLDPAAYPDSPQSVDFVQTHISYVFLAGDLVYKLKKPVDFGFLDYTTPELRHQACIDEVRLNRRLSPDIYLGVASITYDGGTFRVDGSGPACDWAVQMRRLPAARMLESLIAARAVPDKTGERLGEVIGRFHLAADRGERVTAVGGRAAVAGNWRENFEQARPYRGQTIAPEDDDRVQAYVGSFLEQEQPLLEARDAEGFIRDLHGDLRSAQIWVLEHPPAPVDGLTSGERQMLAEAGNIRVLDCIEFSERIRFCDTASDIAFLAADFDWRRRSDLSLTMLCRYLEVTSDVRLPLLLRFYSCYRAYVRGKVDSLGLTQREIDGRQRRNLAARARGFFRLAAHYAGTPATQRLIVMMGVSGSGKSVLARLLALRLGAVWLSSDLTRKRIVGVPAHHAAGPAAYTRQVSARTFEAMFAEAETELQRGHTVILDATFLTKEGRRPAIRLAERLGVPMTLVWCQVSPEVMEQRIHDRQRDAFRSSDADLAVARSQLPQLQPPAELPRGAVIHLNADSDVYRLLDQVVKQII